VRDFFTFAATHRRINVPFDPIKERRPLHLIWRNQGQLVGAAADEVAKDRNRQNRENDGTGEDGCDYDNADFLRTGEALKMV